MYKTFKIVSSTEAVFNRATTKQDYAAYPMNVQVSCTPLAGATFDVLILLPGETEFKTHVSGATEIDTVMIAGKDAPLFEAVKVLLNDAIGDITVTLTCWERGI